MIYIYEWIIMIDLIINLINLMKHPISFIFLLAIISAQTLPFYMWINNTDIISDA